MSRPVSDGEIILCLLAAIFISCLAYFATGVFDFILSALGLMPPMYLIIRFWRARL